MMARRWKFRDAQILRRSEKSGIGKSGDAQFRGRMKTGLWGLVPGSAESIYWGGGAQLSWK